MDQTKNNLERIRAFDAEEGEWRTINGAHVLIKNGRIAGGAGGALNGQPFRGGSLKKMQSGYRGEHADRITQKLKEGRAEKTLERLHQRRESQVQRPASRLTKMQAGSKGSKFNENRENASVRKAVKSPLYGAVPAGLNVERAKTALHYDPNRRYTVIKGRRGRRGRNDDPRRYNVLEGARPIATNGYGTIFEADHKHLTVPHYPLGPNEGTARLEPSKTELAARARSLKERRPDLFKAGRPARPASRLTKMPEGQKGMESGAYGRKLKTQAKEVAEKNRAAMARANAKYDRNRNERLKQMGNLMSEASKLPDHSPLEARYRNAYEALAREDQREGRATAATTNALNQEMFDLEGKAARHESNRGEVASRAQRALERYRKSREAERGGTSAPQQSAPHATKLGRMQPGSKAVNAGKEAKRLDHNARVYHRTARRAREAYNAKMDKSGGEPNAIEQKKNAYKAKSYENVSRRDQAAASAKGRLSNLRQLAKSLKARNPNAFKG